MQRNPNIDLLGRPGSRRTLGTPALVLDLDAVEANIVAMAAIARERGYALRPPAKVHKAKSVEIARLQVAAGALGPTCATLAEAEEMVDGDIPGVMLFSTVVTAPKLERLAALNARAERGLLVVTDGAANVAQLGEAARRSGRTLDVLVDLEVGGRRTGVGTPAEALALARRIAEEEGLRFAGLQGYVGDHQSLPSYAERRAASRRLLAPLVEAVELLRADGLPPEIVSGGGTGTVDIDHELGVLTELQPGTYVLGDGNYADVEILADGTSPFVPALRVATTVISDAQAGFAITDGGTKEIDGMLGPVAPRILDGAPAGATYAIVGDDLGRVDLAPGDRLPVGAVLGVPAAALLPDGRDVPVLPRRARQRARRDLAGRRARELVARAGPRWPGPRLPTGSPRRPRAGASRRRARRRAPSRRRAPASAGRRPRTGRSARAGRSAPRRPPASPRARRRCGWR